jgi:beta-lactamase superfamily II metal-dependent hydrolase
MSGRLGVHVINGGIGESILLELPTGGWGVIDCYARSVSDPSTNPTLDFLNKQGVDTLEFLCLTHPHDDHFRGVKHLLDHLQVKAFWRFGAFTPQDLRMLTRYFLVHARKRRKPRAIENAELLLQTFETVKSQFFQRPKVISRLLRLTDRTPAYPLPEVPGAELELWGLGPSSNLVEKYERDLSQCFDGNGKLVGHVAHQRHNDVSCAIMLRYGVTRVLLCGDVEAEGWEEILRLVDASVLAVHAVKVAHHGSSTGYCSDLWKHLSAKGKPVAVVTPFRKFRLPKRAALAHIGEHASAVLTTCKEATGIDEGPTFEYYSPPPLKARLLLETKFKALLRYAPEAGVGVCSFSFGSDGTCEHLCNGSAGEIE